jgi:phosphotransferase family enzyme
VAVNAVAAYLAANHERLGLSHLGLSRRPACVLLTPRFRRSRHVIVLVLPAGRREATLVAKLPRLAGDSEALEREARNLRAVGPALTGAAQGTVPALVAYHDDPAHPLLLQTALHGTPLSPAAVRRDRGGAVAAVTGWLAQLAAATAVAAPDHAWYERLVRAPLLELAACAERPAEERELARRTLPAAQLLQDAGLPLVFEHGDLGHPNLLRLADGRLGVLDWESGEPLGLPLGDLVFFLAYAAAAAPGDVRARLAGVRDAFSSGPHGWAWSLIERHAAALRIEHRLVRPLVAVCCARVVLAAGPASASPDAATRQLVAWREALLADARAPATPSAIPLPA